MDAIEPREFHGQGPCPFDGDLAEGVVAIATSDLIGNALHEDGFLVEDEGVVAHLSLLFECRACVREQAKRAAKRFLLV
jgi:hypothetical protein